MEWEKRLFQFRGLLVMVPVFVAFLWPDGGRVEESVVWSVGPSVFLGAIALRVWAQYHLGYRMPVSTRLTTSGPYRYIRNPIYVANAIMALSVIFMMEVLWVIPLATLWCAVLYWQVVRYEERHLLRKYGEAHRTYLAEVPRWFPWRALGCLWSALTVPSRLKLAFVAEVHCLAILLAPALKEALEHWLHG